jgi:hypothetical protein
MWRGLPMLFEKKKNMVCNAREDSMFRKLGLSVVHLARRFVSVTGTAVVARRSALNGKIWEGTSKCQTCIVSQGAGLISRNAPEECLGSLLRSLW